MFKLIKVNEKNKNDLKNLLEYYLYDFNVYYEDDLNKSGRFDFIAQTIRKKLERSIF